MAASGFGREAGPSTRGPGSAFPTFGVAAATPAATAPSPATPSFPSARPATPSFPSGRPATPSFPSARPAAPSLTSARPTTHLAAATTRFPSPRPQLAAAATASRPATTPPMPIPVPSARTAAASGSAASTRFPSPRPTLDPGAAAATGRHVARLLQPQPRPATLSVSGAVDPSISSSRAISAVSNPRADSPADYDNGMGQRRLVNYADPLFENGSLQSSEQLRMRPSEHMRSHTSARSPPSNIASKFRPPSDSQDHHPAHIADPRDNVLVDYTDTLIGDENVETSKRMRSPASEFTHMMKSSPSGIRDNIRSSPNSTQNLRVHADVQKSNTSLQKFGNLIQSRIGGAQPERAERERKGDLDRYERLDGDRNLTTELLAVKKYNRTAERDADLIRPLPVLQKTMDYLLSLLDHTYDDSFLSLYNFLWDRMRAIRMDLRMQHFFNQEAISMLEQMIRLHIIAMHELCEYNKGEGFSEGFDAHLNIEQMNKTSVELFQMYDDHRRKGVFFSTEKEFRGYYALLKLDKHPGYKVEPAELSLDLAKMSREIRGSPEILFAREVARASRMGNFIAFFRLARKATYLQACLMHAHFAKLRRQALASLHSGLQSGQGIPISQVVEWLAMEDEDIESLLEYYGFGLRHYEELYLVKEGPFLNSESDFPSGCSQLVHSKKSQRVIVDVSSGPVCAPISKDNTSVSSPSRIVTGKRDLFPSQHAPVVPHGGRREVFSLFSGPVSTTPGKQISMPFSDSFSPKAANKLFSPTSPTPLIPNAGREDSASTFPTPASPHSSKSEIFSRMPRVLSPKAKGKTKFANDLTAEDQDSRLAESPQEVEMQTEILWSHANTEKINALTEPIASHSHTDSISLDYSNMLREEETFREDMDQGTPPHHEVLVIKPELPIGSPLSDHNEYMHHNISNSTVDDWLPIVMPPKKQISDEKLKGILRKWRQRAADKRSLREQKNALAVAALCSLSLGPPVHNTTMVPKLAVEELDIGHAFKERQTRQQRSWSWLNVSELSAPILLETNPDARCLCWKFLVLVPAGAMESQTINFASKWLLRKLMGSGNGDSGLIVSSVGLSIWTEWISFPNTCCLSVVRASDQQVIGNDIANGTSCIAFVVSEGISWEMQKARLNSLLASIPDQSNLPLLILSGDTYHEGYDYASQYIIDRLGLSDFHGGKIASSLVIFLIENMEDYANGFFDDDKLREGLKWLIRNLPRQPDITLVKTHELLLSYLNPQLELLNAHAAPGAGPGDCISVFNNAVDQVVEEIMAAAQTNINQWPALEIDLLEGTSNERIYAEAFLPSIGWSSPSRIQPLLAAISTCKIPEFSYDLSCLKQGSHMGKQTQDQKKLLQECLARYLTEATPSLDETQVATEVNIMVQRYVGLELRDSYYYLVPRWLAIFRRIYNWRLSKLSTGEFSEAYVQSQHLYQAPVAANSNGATGTQGLTASGNTCDESSILEDHSMMPTVSSGLSLDEIIEVSCDLDDDHAEPASQQPRPPTWIHEEPHAPASIGEEPHAPANTNGETNMVHGVSEMYMPRRIESRELLPLERDDKLARLLEQCTKLQDRIHETLSIYF
nr:unnamed protein product [Digitaria exilis]